MSAYVAVTLYGGDKSQMLHSSAYARLVEHLLWLYQIWYVYKNIRVYKILLFKNVVCVHIHFFIERDSACVCVYACIMPKRKDIYIHSNRLCATVYTYNFMYAMLQFHLFNICSQHIYMLRTCVCVCVKIKIWETKEERNGFYHRAYASKRIWVFV